ncbi:MAG: Fur family transcriptional regulator [Alphaproteobacteria bacterium]
MVKVDGGPVFADKGHDHAQCVTRAISGAEEICRTLNLQLTDLRRQVLEIIWGSHKPIGAYDILAALAVKRGRVAPPTVYRSLDFLLSHGLVHRIETLNAYVGCRDPGGDHDGQFLICSDCGTAAELNDPQMMAAVARSIRLAGFQPVRQTIEVSGLCPECVESPQNE